MTLVKQVASTIHRWILPSKSHNPVPDLYPGVQGQRHSSSSSNMSDLTTYPNMPNKETRSGEGKRASLHSTGMPWKRQSKHDSPSSVYRHEL
jgi:hypothetical protein